MEGIGAEVLQGLRMQYATEEQMEEAAAFKPKRWLWEAVQNLELPSVAGFFKTARFNSLEQKVVQVRLPCQGVGECRGLGMQALDTGRHACYG